MEAGVFARSRAVEPCTSACMLLRRTIAALCSLRTIARGACMVAMTMFWIVVQRPLNRMVSLFSVFGKVADVHRLMYRCLKSFLFRFFGWVVFFRCEREFECDIHAAGACAQVHMLG